MIRSLSRRGKSRVPKETKDDPVYISKRTRAEWAQNAIDRDVERRRKEREEREKGNRSSPMTKHDLTFNMEVHEG